MSQGRDLDLSELQRLWSKRRAALSAILRRFDTRGMTRPARDPDERRWMEGRTPGPFVEVEAIGAVALAYYRRRYSRAETLPE